MSYSVSAYKAEQYQTVSAVSSSTYAQYAAGKIRTATTQNSSDTVNISQQGKALASAPLTQRELEALSYTPVQSLVTKNGERVSVEAAWDSGQKNCLAVRITITRPDGTLDVLYKQGTTVLSESSNGKLEASDGGHIISMGDTDDIIIALPSKNGFRTQSIDAGNGNNTIIDLSGGSSTIKTGDGSDMIIGKGGNFTIDSGAGNDVITVQGEQVTITGGAGNDNITVTARRVDIDGGAGSDFIRVHGATEGEIRGGDGNDTIETSESSNLTIEGGAGDDNIHLKGLTANSRIDGGEGNDTIHADTLENSEVTGGSGIDKISVRNAGGSDIDGGFGGDTITVGYSRDTRIRGGGGQDAITVKNTDSASGRNATNLLFDQFTIEADKREALATGRVDGLAAYFRSSRFESHSRYSRNV